MSSKTASMASAMILARRQRRKLVAGVSGPRQGQRVGHHHPGNRAPTLRRSPPDRTAACALAVAMTEISEAPPSTGEARPPPRWCRRCRSCRRSTRTAALQRSRTTCRSLGPRLWRTRGQVLWTRPDRNPRCWLALGDLHPSGVGATRPPQVPAGLLAHIGLEHGGRHQVVKRVLKKPWICSGMQVDADHLGRHRPPEHVGDQLRR